MHEEDPKDLFLRYALAMEYIALQDETEATNLLKAIIADDSHHIASYYQLGKLIQKLNEEEALSIFERGFQEAILQKNQRTANEFRAAIDELTY